MTRRSMPPSFHVNLFALMPVHCPSSTCVSVMAETLRVRTSVCTRFLCELQLSSGKRDPQFGRILGCAFRLGPLAETTTRNIGSERDTLSRTGLNRKAHPSLRPQNGTQFPPDQPLPPFRRSVVRIGGFVHRKYMNRCSIYAYLPACFLSKNFATPKTQSRQGFSCPTVGT